MASVRKGDIRKFLEQRDARPGYRKVFGFWIKDVAENTPKRASPKTVLWVGRRTAESDDDYWDRVGHPNPLK